MRISSITKSCNLSANLEGMRTSENKAKIDDFLRNSEDRRFGFKKVVEKATNKLVEHVSGEAIQVEQFPNDFELGVKVFIARAEVENSVK